MGAHEQRDGLGGPSCIEARHVGPPPSGSCVMNREVGYRHTRRFSGTVLDGGGVGNTNPRPPLDEVGSMSASSNCSLTWVSMRDFAGMSRMINCILKSKFSTKNEANGHETHVGVPAGAA